MSSEETDWTFFSQYAYVLMCLAENPRARLRDIAERIGLTERTAGRLINRLERAGIVRRTRQGRRNYYQIDTDRTLLHPMETGWTLERLLAFAIQADFGEKMSDPVDQCRKGAASPDMD